MENQGFIIDIKDYYKIIRKEFYYIINEVGGHTLKCEYFYIGMIPFKPNINGILLDNENIIKFECDDIRAEIGSGLPLFKEIFEFEQQNALYYEENELNIKKCETNEELININVDFTEEAINEFIPLYIKKFGDANEQ